VFKRIHLPEIEDFAAVPSWYRNLMTDCLEVLSFHTGAYNKALPLLERLIALSGKRELVDFGSGAGGPWLHTLFPRLQSKFSDLNLTLTDLFPNEDIAEKISRTAQPQVRYLVSPVDMTDPPPNLKGIRIMFTSFHHLTPEDAKRALQSAVDAREPLGVFEVTGRSVGHLLMTFMIPLLVLLVTPFIPGKRIQRVIFTYLIPIVPLGCFWDGVASNFRTYSITELGGLVASLKNCENYIFEKGEFSALGPIKGVYLIGYLELSS